mgnify:CR=1 FL=1
MACGAFKYRADGSVNMGSKSMGFARHGAMLALPVLAALLSGCGSKANNDTFDLSLTPVASSTDSAKARQILVPEPTALIRLGARQEPLAQQRPFGIGDAGRVVHRHDLGHHRLLVDALRMLLHALDRIQPQVLHLHLLAVAHVAALLQHHLQRFVVILAPSACC